VLFRYVDRAGNPTAEANPNGALRNIAGIMNASRNVFGMMPHPEHAGEAMLGGVDGLKLFRSLIHHGRRTSAPRGAARASKPLETLRP
jgi:phosphoribosylformylglycinamidine synthase